MSEYGLRTSPPPPPANGHGAGAGAGEIAMPVELNGDRLRFHHVQFYVDSLKPLEYYDHVKWEEWSEMPIKRRMEVQQARIAAGMPSVQLSWGTWEADVALAPEILAKAPRELGELREVCTEHA